MWMEIDRDSSMPLHVQLRDTLVERIRNGDWKPGSRIPGDEELCEIFKLSRTVVRQALGDLVHEGWIYRERGKGTFVAEPRVSGVGLAKSLDTFCRSLNKRGIEIKTQILEKGIVPAQGEAAEKLEVDLMVPLIRVVQLFIVGGAPLFVISTHIPYDSCRELIFADLSRRSIYEFLEEQCHISIERADRKMTAVLAERDEAELLEINLGEPLLHLESVSFSSEGEPLEYLSGYFLGKRVQFEVEILQVLGDQLSGS